MRGHEQRAVGRVDPETVDVYRTRITDLGDPLRRLVRFPAASKDEECDGDGTYRCTRTKPHS